MKLILVTFSLLLFTLQSQASDLGILQNKKIIMKFNSEIWKTESLTKEIKGHFISKEIFNIHRREKKTYEGFNLEHVLNHAFGKVDWRKNKKIRFFAKDGVVKEASLSEMFKGMKKHVGVIAIRNKGKKNLDIFVKGINTIYPGPFYLVWSGFSKEDYSGGAYKWPYHLSKIVLIK